MYFDLFWVTLNYRAEAGQDYSDCSSFVVPLLFREQLCSAEWGLEEGLVDQRKDLVFFNFYKQPTEI